MGAETVWQTSIEDFEVVTVQHEAGNWTTSIYIPKTAASSVAPVRRLYAQDKERALHAHKFCVRECRKALKKVHSGT